MQVDQTGMNHLFGAAPGTSQEVPRVPKRKGTSSRGALPDQRNSRSGELLNTCCWSKAAGGPAGNQHGAAVLRPVQIGQIRQRLDEIAVRTTGQVGALLLESLRSSATTRLK